MKKLKVGLIAIIALVVMCGCALSKTPATSQKFISAAEGNKLITGDVKEKQFSEYNQIKEAIVAASTEGWQVEFYVLTDASEAKSMYEKNKTIFEGEAEGGTKIKMDVGNYTKFSIKTKDKYYLLERVDNTLFYANVPVAAKDTVDKLLKDIGY